jgi:DNA polymerase
MGKFIEGVTISRVHGQPRFVDFAGKRYIVYPMFHPAAALRSGSMMKPFEEDFVKLSTLLTKPVSVAEAKDNNGQLNLF